MYATLDEAYQTPFLEPRKRRRAKVPQQEAHEDFTGGMGLSTAPKDAYTGRLNDYTFGCKQYGVCPKTLKNEPITEGFENQKKGPALTKQHQKCAPLSASNYEYPLSDADKSKFKAAMDASLNEDFDHPPVDMKPSRVIDMNMVGGYGDDDLDQYLSLDNMKDQILLPPMPQKSGARAAAPYDPEPRRPGTSKTESPFEELLREAAGNRKQRLHMPPRPMEEVTVAVRAPMWMDLILFVLIGILIILIMDQLFRLAMVVGMRQTLEILRPLLEQP